MQVMDQSQPKLRLAAPERMGVVAVLAVLLAGCGGQAGSAGGGAGVDTGGMISAGGTAVKAFSLSDADIKALSDKSCATLDARSKIASPQSKEARRLARILKGMPTTVSGVPINAKVYLTQEVNAWAMGNGCVRVYSGLMALMNDDEVRGVIGHELGHVALGHSKSSMQSAYMISAARQTAASTGNGAVSALSTSQLGDLAEKFVNAQFSQAQESAADDYSFDLLTLSKFRREGLATAFEKLASQGNKSSMLSSHPSSADRARHVRDRIAAGK